MLQGTSVKSFMTTNMTTKETINKAVKYSQGRINGRPTQVDWILAMMTGILLVFGIMMVFFFMVLFLLGLKKTFLDG